MSCPQDNKRRVCNQSNNNNCDNGIIKQTNGNGSSRDSGVGEHPLKYIWNKGKHANASDNNIESNLKDDNWGRNELPP